MAHSISEATIERTCVQLAARAGAWLLKFNSTNQRGVPDRILLTPNGQTVFVEFKRKGKKPTRLQHHIHAKMRKLHQQVHVCDSVAQFEHILQEALAAPSYAQGEHALHPATHIFERPD